MTSLPIFCSSPERERGIPVLREIRDFKVDRPTARRHENENPRIEIQILEEVVPDPSLADLVSVWLRENGCNTKLKKIDQFYVLSKAGAGNYLWISDSWVWIPSWGVSNKIYAFDHKMFDKLKAQLNDPFGPQWFDMMS